MLQAPSSVDYTAMIANRAETVSKAGKQQASKDVQNLGDQGAQRTREGKEFQRSYEKETDKPVAKEGAVREETPKPADIEDAQEAAAIVAATLLPLQQQQPVIEEAAADIAADVIAVGETPQMPQAPVIQAQPQLQTQTQTELPPQVEQPQAEVPFEQQANQQDVGIIEGFELPEVDAAMDMPEAAVPEQADEKPLDHANTAARDEAPKTDVVVEHLTVDRHQPAEKQRDDTANNEPKGEALEAPVFNTPAPVADKPAPFAETLSNAPAPVQEPPVATQIVERMHIELSSEAKTFTMQLKPESLGRVQVELLVTEDGLSAKIKAEDPAAKGLIAQEISQLTEALKDKGVQVVDMEVILDQTMQDMKHFTFSRDGQNEAGQETQRPFATITSAMQQGGMFEGPVEALVAATLRDTASVEFTA